MITCKECGKEFQSLGFARHRTAHYEARQRAEKEKIGNSVLIEEGLYTVVKPDKDTEMFLARCVMSGYHITSFKMNFGKQTGIYIGNGRAMLAGGVVIIELYENPKTTN